MQHQDYMFNSVNWHISHRLPVDLLGLDLTLGLSKRR